MYDVCCTMYDVCCTMYALRSAFYRKAVTELTFHINKATDGDNTRPVHRRHFNNQLTHWSLPYLKLVS